MFTSRRFLGAPLLLLLVASASGQQGATFKSQTNLVLVPIESSGIQCRNAMALPPED